jgi:hypothetical protein
MIEPMNLVNLLGVQHGSRFRAVRWRTPEGCSFQAAAASSGSGKMKRSEEAKMFFASWSLRKIERHLHLARKTIRKYLHSPMPAPPHRQRSSKLDLRLTDRWSFLKARLQAWSSVLMLTPVPFAL